MIRNRYIGAITDKPWWLAGGIPSSACVVAYAPKGASDYTASKVNLANPGTYNATDGTSYPTWAVDTGWTFNGVNNFLNSNYIPSRGANLSIFARANQFEPKNNTETVIGQHAASSPYNGVWIRFSSTAVGNYLYANDGETTQTATKYPGDNTNGFAGKQSYANGIPTQIISNKTQDFGNYNMAIGALRYSSIIQNFTGSIYAIVIYQYVITSQQVVALTNAMNAL